MLKVLHIYTYVNEVTNLQSLNSQQCCKHFVCVLYQNVLLTYIGEEFCIVIVLFRSKYSYN